MINIINIFEKYMLFLGIVGQVGAYLQAYKLFVKKNATGLSITACFIGVIVAASWLVYGILLKNSVLIFSNALGLAGSSLVVSLALKYRK